jgi:tryptophan 2,3-dioxygenase
MANELIDGELVAQLAKLKAKYEAMGQDLASYLDGLLHADYLTYWDYIHLDTLLSLQNPKTQFPDEKIFIIYHQITELYFRLILHELEQLVEDNALHAATFITRLDRINRYFHHLENSFDVMVDGMNREQFLSFRMSLLPASGFQSAQYRFIELYATDIENLMQYEARVTHAHVSIPLQLEKLYWRSGATELATGKKTLTLVQFEKKYMEEFLRKGEYLKDKNLWQLFQKYFQHTPEESAIVERLRTLDTYANVLWPLAHFKSAARYLQKDPEAIKATGGTNWQSYLPPRFQRVIFYASLWSEEEQKKWGSAAFQRP